MHLRTQKKPVPSQRKLLVETFEKNKKAFYGAATPDTQNLIQKSKLGKQKFEPYLN